MDKFILIKDIPAFIERMWESGLQTDLKPKDKEITVWSEGFSKRETVTVIESSNLADTVNQVRGALLPLTDEIGNTREACALDPELQ